MKFNAFHPSQIHFLGQQNIYYFIKVNKLTIQYLVDTA